MARTGEKRAQPASTMLRRNNASGTGQFPDIPLDLAAPKRFRFMIDHLLDVNADTDEKPGKLTRSKHDDNVNDDEGDGMDPLESDSASGSVEQVPKTSPSPGNSQMLQNVTCRLEGRDLWSKFYELSTEMIITKSGRLVFFNGT